MTKTKLNNVILLKKGKKPKLLITKSDSNLKPYVDIKTFETGVIDNYTDGDKCVECQDGDLLIVCDGSRSGLVGRALNGYIGSTLARIDVDKCLDKEYLYYFIQSKYYQLNTSVKGTGTPHLNQELLKSFDIFIPPIEEQRRIVSRIEELFSELDSAVETLQKTRQQLEIYRQAVLKEAFEIHDSENIVEINSIVESIRIGPFGTMLHKSDYIIGGIPVINPQHIKNGSVVSNINNSVSEENAKELENYKLLKNDIIMGRRGEMGRTAPITDKENGWLCGTGSIFFRLKPEFDAVLYSKILSSPDVVHYLEENATGTTMKNLNEDIVKHIPVPYITKQMQKEITNQIEMKMSVCDSIEKTVNECLQQAEAMRQSILKKAFEREL